MKISDNYFSHPNKNYNDHITKIAQSFDDEKHKVVAHYHDLGKLSKAFQTYIALQKEPSESNEAFEKRRNKLKTTHTLESAYLYFCNEETRDNNFLANFFTILKHHSDLGDIDKEIKEYISVIDIQKERLSTIEDISKKSNLLFDDDLFMFKYFFKKDIKNNCYSLENFFLFKQRYSRLILADKFEAIFSKPYQNIEYFTQVKIDEYFQTLHSHIAKKQEEYPNEYRTNARETIFKNFEQKDDSNIYLIKAPTGIGKTFIALELALKIAKKHHKRRIITAIPFTSIIDQTHQEYEGVLGSGKVLKYHHLTKYQQDDTDEKEQFSQKLFLADIWHEHFIVTTFNQLLYTLFSNHNRDNVRLETLRESVIIIDEVQNIPRVLLQNIAKVFEMFAKQYDMHIIIMSATMPHIYEAFDKVTVLSEDWFYDTKQNRYRLHYQMDVVDFGTLANAIHHHTQKSVLCVVNTIEKAKELYEEIDGDKYLLTTHQTPKHRKAILRLIRYRLKKGHKIKLISTQLIEAGVDLDFDVGYREFAPFGSIIQTAGRVNREGGKGISDVYIFDCIDVGRGEVAQKAPYQAIDYQEKHIKNLIEKPLDENAILKHMNDYFIALRVQTVSADLQTPMKNLEFATLFDRLNENFMPKQPWKVSLFVEQKEGHFDDYISERKKILSEDENKFEALNRVKELEKDLGLFTISINKSLIEKLINEKHQIKELFGRYILPYGSKYYTKYTGFDLALTIEEEAFSS